MKARVLVIDDERSIRFTFEKFIGRAGHEVETATTLREGLERIAERSYDLVFADIILGSETGIEILREIRRRELTCPLIFITGYPTIDTASEAVRLGAFDYLPKPVHRETLLKTMKLALQHKSLVDENERYRSNLEAIFRSVKDVIITVDGDLLLVEFNRAAKDLCGLSREEVGKPFGSLPNWCQGRCLEALKEAIETREPTEFHRFECNPAGNQRRVLSLTASPLFGSGGVFSGAVVVVRDETCLVDLERNLGERRQFHRIVGKSEKMQQIYSLVQDLANVKTSVLITGESGTGKELLAEAIHYEGNLKDEPLVKVNCSALSENLLESELFGHVKGAFTGAIKDKVGRFQLADGGTIFLDEIGDISPAIQQRLLRVLQEWEFERVGDSKPIRVDVRVIAATNKNLPERIKGGDFREDLYYRLKVVEITLPPLRNRREDIPLLVDHFIGKFNARLGRAIEAVSDDVLKIFMEHLWPGNVRQLAHTLEHAFILCHQKIITLDHLPPDFMSNMRTTQPFVRAKEECEAILQALENTLWNKTRAARLLGMSRRTFYRKIDEYGIMKRGSNE